MFPQLKRRQTTPASRQRPSSAGESRFLNWSRSKNTYTINYAPPSRPSWCKQSYLEDERNGKKSYMVRAKDLIIAFGNDSGNWKWRFDDDSREVAELCSSWTLDVGAKMGAGLLKPRSVYTAYLVYKVTETAEELESGKGIIRFVDDESDREVVGERVVQLHLAGEEGGEGWMEVEIGIFYVGRDDGAVEARLLETEMEMWACCSRHCVPPFFYL